MKRKENAREEGFVSGSGNVFADLGLPNPEESLLKAQLAIRLNERIDGMKCSQVELASKLGISQPHVSLIRNYRLQGFSADRLMQFLVKLGLQVTVQVAESPSLYARLSVASQLAHPHVTASFCGDAVDGIVAHWARKTIESYRVKIDSISAEVREQNELPTQMRRVSANFRVATRH